MFIEKRFDLLHTYMFVHTVTETDKKKSHFGRKRAKGNREENNYLYLNVHIGTPGEKSAVIEELKRDQLYNRAHFQDSRSWKSFLVFGLGCSHKK